MQMRAGKAYVNMRWGEHARESRCIVSIFYFQIDDIPHKYMVWVSHSREAADNALNTRFWGERVGVVGPFNGVDGNLIDSRF